MKTLHIILLLFICSISFSQVLKRDGVLFAPEFRSNKGYPLDGQAYRLDQASTQYTFFADSGLFDIVNMGGGGVNLWFNTTINDANFRILFTKGILGSDPGRYAIFIQNGGVGVYVNPNEGLLITSSKSALNNGEWHHVSWNIDTSGYSIVYFDNVKFDSVDTSGKTWSEADDFPNSLKTSIGSASNSVIYAAERSFDGDIRDVRLYPRALLTSEVNTVYQGKGLGDEVFWLMPLTNGHFDMSGNGYDFTRVNFNPNSYISGDYPNPMNFYGWNIDGSNRVPFDYSTRTNILPNADIDGTALIKFIPKR